ncbi:ABC transporter permease [Rufibacter sp. DG15C]|uniref:ABC transporter permease n=1 Tax=Rufibacter sp. DG15C TaxID=1379909 RepID=UPI00083398A1|nr:ABC transporter permease [Rufibacter sp. DG15C]
MPLKRLFLKLAGLALAIWGTVTALFFLSQLVPAFHSPKGMSEVDAAVYGNSSSLIRQQVKDQYQQRMGYHLPLFYFSIKPYGIEKGEQLHQHQPTTLIPFSGKATLWHGEKATDNFLKEWRLATPEISALPQGRVKIKELSQLLNGWVNSQTPSKKRELEAQFLLNSQKTGQKRLTSLAKAWQDLLADSSPVWYYLPILHWEGSNNQYNRWIKEIFSGDLGISAKDYRPVTDKVLESLQVSAAIGLPGLAIAILFSLGVGFWLSIPKKTILKSSVTQLLYVLDSLPGFMITLGFFALYLTLGGDLSSNYMGESLAFSGVTSLGSFCVAMFLLPYLTLFFHQSILQEQSKLYLRTALAKGLSYHEVLLIHAIPNAIASAVVVVADILASLIAGVLIVEVTFSLPGTGSLLAQSLLTQDFPTVIGLTVFLLVFRTVLMWLADITNALLDPRKRTI